MPNPWCKTHAAGDEYFTPDPSLPFLRAVNERMKALRRFPLREDVAGDVGVGSFTVIGITPPGSSPVSGDPAQFYWYEDWSTASDGSSTVTASNHTGGTTSVDVHIIIDATAATASVVRDSSSTSMLWTDHPGLVGWSASAFAAMWAAVRPTTPAGGSTPPPLQMESPRTPPPAADRS